MGAGDEAVLAGNAVTFHDFRQVAQDLRHSFEFSGDWPDAQPGCKGKAQCCRIDGGRIALKDAGLILLIPIGFIEAWQAFGTPALVLAGIGVGICSSVIPYVCDQLAMSRLPRSSFALLLALLPATATIIAAIVLAQIPTGQDILGVALVMAGVAVHKPAQAA